MRRLLFRRWSRSARTPLATAHPWRWLTATGVLLALLSVGAYTHARAAYPADVRADWDARRRQAYELWRDSFTTSTRNVVMLVGLLLMLYTFRRFRLALLVRRAGPIEVAEFENATPDKNLLVADLTVRFRTALARVNLNSPASVPGAGRPTEFLELLKTAGSEKNLMASVAGLLGVTSVSHAFRVSAVLRQGRGATPCGITVSVAILPTGGTTPVTVWGRDWPKAVDSAAMAVGAAILPLTRLCSKPPWHGWRGLALPSELFADYLEAKSLAAEHRYDEALGKFYDALARDPLNLYLRLEVAYLQEQLRLFLDALETYDDIIALGTRKDERLARPVVDLWERLRREPKAAAGRGPARHLGRRRRAGLQPAAWRIRSTNLQRVLLFARYRYALVLGFSEVFVAQWIKEFDDKHSGGHLSGGASTAPQLAGDARGSTPRDRERFRLRSRLVPRLSLYDDKRPAADDERSISPILVAVTPPDDTSVRHQQLVEQMERELRKTIRAVRRKAATTPKCADQHPEFWRRFSAAKRLEDDQRPASARALHAAAKAVRAAAAVCRDKDWSDDLAVVRRILPKVGPEDPFHPTGLEVLRAQELMQEAALAEVRQLYRDYRWWKGRRRLHISVTSRALRVSGTWASLRLSRVQWLISCEKGAKPLVWPPQFEGVRTEVHRTLKRSPWLGYEWQDYYNAACVYAIVLLPANSWAGQATSHRLALRDLPPHVRDRLELTDSRYASATVRCLERAMDTSDSSFVAGRRNWVASEDPDLIGLRTRQEYAQFRARNFPVAQHAVPQPMNVHVLQLSAYVTELLRGIASAELHCWNRDVTLPASGPSGDRVAGLFERDRRSWATVTDVALGHRDWRVRLEALRHVRSIAADDDSIGAVAYPSYPDPRIGDLRSVSDPSDVRCLTVAAAYARQERVAQVGRLADVMRDHLTFLATMGSEMLDGVQAYRLRHSCDERAKLWRLFQQCLAVDFFTDDKAELGRRKDSANRAEERFTDAVASFPRQQARVVDLRDTASTSTSRGSGP